MRIADGTTRAAEYKIMTNCQILSPNTKAAKPNCCIRIDFPAAAVRRAPRNQEPCIEEVNHD